MRNKVIRQLLERREISERDIILEAHKRGSLIETIRGHLFDKQLAFIDDPATLKTLQCDRRASKSYTVGADFVLTGLQYPGVSMLYIAMTRDQARKVMYKDVLKTINRKFKIGLKFNKQILEVSFPNGSILYLMGLDATADESDKALGQKFKKVTIDEAASFKQDQRYMIYSTLLPAMADLEGTINMIGAPANNTGTLYYDIVGRNDDDPKKVRGWSQHKWSWRDNPHTRDKVQKVVDKILADNPLAAETPWFKQMYCNEWVIDPEALVYKFNPERNLAPALPQEHEYYFGLGLDMGYEDDTAFTIAAYSPTDTVMYFVKAYKRKHMDITDVANMLNAFKQQYNPIRYIVDGASKQAVEELRTRYGFPLEAADKTGKSDIIELMNADFIMAKIKLLPEAAPLQAEYADLVWDFSTAGKRVENRFCANHCSDSGLYNWRMCFHFASKPAPKKASKGSEEEMDEWWEKEAEKLAAKDKEPGWMTDLKKEYGFR